MIPALAVVKLARIEVVRKWDYRHFGAQCLVMAQGCTDPAAPYRRLTGEHRPRIFAQRRSSARPSLTLSGSHWIANGAMRKVSLPLDVRRLDDGPPFLDFGLLKRAERLGRLLVAGRNLLPEVGEQSTCRRIVQGIPDRRVQLGNDGLGRALRRPKSLPVRGVQSR